MSNIELAGTTEQIKKPHSSDFKQRASPEPVK